MEPCIVSLAGRIDAGYECQVRHPANVRSLNIQQSGIELRPNSARVLIRPFIPGDTARVVNIIGRALALSEAEIEEQLVAVTEDFGSRHLNLRTFWRRHFERAKAHLFTGRPLSEPPRLYIATLFPADYPPAT